jgi:DNA mismatch endonuclease (patch repair protein)
MAHVPKSNQQYWGPKLERNKTRDREAVEALETRGWQSLTVWECETRDDDGLEGRLRRFLGRHA